MTTVWLLYEASTINHLWHCGTRPANCDPGLAHVAHVLLGRAVHGAKGPQLSIRLTGEWRDQKCHELIEATPRLFLSNCETWKWEIFCTILHTIINYNLYLHISIRPSSMFHCMNMQLILSSGRWVRTTYIYLYICYMLYYFGRSSRSKTPTWGEQADLGQNPASFIAANQVLKASMSTLSSEFPEWIWNWFS